MQDHNRLKYPGHIQLNAPYIGKKIKHNEHHHENDEDRDKDKDDEKEKKRYSSLKKINPIK